MNIKIGKGCQDVLLLLPLVLLLVSVMGFYATFAVLSIFGILNCGANKQFVAYIIVSIVVNIIQIFIFFLFKRKTDKKRFNNIPHLIVAIIDLCLLIWGGVFTGLNKNKLDKNCWPIYWSLALYAVHCIILLSNYIYCLIAGRNLWETLQTKIL